jgi:2-oxoglutarate ferredoxin oxidoreductase subunit delta
MTGKKDPASAASETVVAELDGRKVAVHPRRCKGCEICVRLCPKHVLGIRDFKAHVERLADCSECMLCEMRCPDFAIEVTASAKKGQKGTP